MNAVGLAERWVNFIAPKGVYAGLATSLLGGIYTACDEHADGGDVLLVTVSGGPILSLYLWFLPFTGPWTVAYLIAMRPWKKEITSNMLKYK